MGKKKNPLRTIVLLIGLILALGSLAFQYAYGFSNPNIYLSSNGTPTCHPATLEMSASVYPIASNIAATGILNGNQTPSPCAGDTVYYWVESSNGAVVYQSSTVATGSGSPITYTPSFATSQMVSNAAGSYTLYASLCSKADQNSCGGAVNGLAQASFELSQSANTYTETITFMGNGAIQPNVQAALYDSTSTERCGGLSNSQGQIVCALASGTYSLFYFPMTGTFVNGQATIDVSASNTSATVSMNMQTTVTTTNCSGGSITCTTSSTSQSSSTTGCTQPTTTVVTNNGNKTTLTLQYPFGVYPLCEAPRVTFNVENTVIAFGMGLLGIGLMVLSRKV